MQDKNLHSGVQSDINTRMLEIIGADTVREISGQLGVHYNTVRKWIREGAVPGGETLAKLCELKRINFEWMVYGKGEKYKDRIESKLEDNDEFSLETLGRSVPLISWIQAGVWSEIEDTFNPGDAEDWIPTRSKFGKHSFALRINGDSMEPMFNEGDVIIVDPEIPAESGRYVIAKIETESGENGMATFKRFIVDGHKIYLRPLNKTYDPMDMTGKKFKIVGCVVSVVRDIIL